MMLADWSVDVGGVSVGWVVCKLLQSGALVCGCGQRLCGLAWKKVEKRIKLNFGNVLPSPTLISLSLETAPHVV